MRIAPPPLLVEILSKPDCHLCEEELPAAEIINPDLLTYLKDWLNYHILIEDKAYRKLAEMNPSACEAAKTFRASEIWWTG